MSPLGGSAPSAHRAGRDGPGLAAGAPGPAPLEDPGALLAGADVSPDSAQRATTFEDGGASLAGQAAGDLAPHAEQPRARAASLVVADQLVVSGASFATSVLLARSLGLEGFGVFAIAWTVVLLALHVQKSLVTLPMLAIAPRRAGADRAGYEAAVLALELALTALIVLAVGLGWPWLAALFGAPPAGVEVPLQGLAALAWPLAAVAGARQLQGFTRGACFARSARGAALVEDLVAHLGGLLALVALLLAGSLTLASALWALAATALAGALVGLARFERRLPSRAALAEAFGRHRRSGQWLVAMVALQWTAQNAYLVAAGALLGIGAAGALKAAQVVLGAIHVAFLALENVVPVRAARVLAARGRAAMERDLLRLAVPGLFATAALAVLLALAAAPLLALVYGQADGGAVLALRVLACLYPPALAVTFLSIRFRALERTRPIFLAYAAAALLAALSAEPLVRHLGLAGAAWGMVAQQLLLALLLTAATRAGRPRPHRR